MFALRGHGPVYSGQAAAAYVVPEAHGVLPRPLRRMARFAVSLGQGRVAIPRHAGTLSLVAFLGLTGLYGMALGGHTRVVADTAGSAAGFSIDNVKVSGNLQTSEVDILQQLGLDGSSSVLSLSAAEARKRLVSLPWVRDAEVRKVYPDTVDVKLSERTAFAIWQHDDQLSLIEKDGTVIAPLRDNKFASLPLFVGDGASQEAANFQDMLSAWPDIQSRVKAYICIGGRRWNLELDNGVTLKLPEADVARALDWVSKMEAKNQLLERDIVAIDLRLADRTSIQLTEDAAKRRDKLVAERNKELKKIARSSL